MQVNGSKVPFKIDTGAEANCISEKDHHKLPNKTKLIKKKIKLKCYNETKVNNKVHALLN